MNEMLAHEAGSLMHNFVNGSEKGLVSGMVENSGEPDEEKEERMKTVPAMLKPVAEILQQIADDRTVPRNIRGVADESLKVLAGGSPSGPDDSGESLNLRVSTAISMLDEIINDPNMPMYTRTQIWNAVSILEQCRGGERKD